MTTVQSFVAETLRQVRDAINDFNAESEDKVGPAGKVQISRYRVGEEALIAAGYISTTAGVATKVEFDIAITTAESNDVDGKAGIKVASLLELGGGGATSQSSSNVSRVKFNLPLALPTKTYPEDQLN